MFYPVHGRVGRYARELAEAPGLRIAQVMSPERLAAALGDCDVTYRDRVFNPLVTLWAFCWQVMAAGAVCSEAVARVLAWRISSGLKPCSTSTGSYCQARQRLPPTLIQTLLRDMARVVQDQVDEAYLWKGRHVKIVDGSTVTMPDTPANQKRFPQAPTQKPGPGSPIVRLVAVFSLHTAAVLDLAIGPYGGKQTGENSLFRRLLDHLRPGEVVLADRAFSGYADLALIAAQGADVVMRKHQRRKTDLKRAERLGKGDCKVVWNKPARCPAWMEPAAFDALPDQRTVREVTVSISIKGFRTNCFTVVTTLLDAKVFTASDLAALYRRRWEAELNLRSLKVTMGMDVLQCKTPEMVEKELWMPLLAYNLVRITMAQAGAMHGCDPSRLSFASSLYLLRQFHATGLLHARHMDTILLIIAQLRVPYRPDRVEPRAIKDRGKPQKHLTEPREQARQQLRSNH